MQLKLNQENLITFTLVDATNTEVIGLGAVFTVEISKGTGALVPGVGVRGEIGMGWYYYFLTAAECDTVGPLSFLAYGAGTVQQNWPFVVESYTVNAIWFTYTMLYGITPIPQVVVTFATDPAMNNVVWVGITDSFGVARSNSGLLPLLDPGTYYVFRRKAGWSFSDPDVEVVS